MGNTGDRYRLRGGTDWEELLENSVVWEFWSVVAVATSFDLTCNDFDKTMECLQSGPQYLKVDIRSF